MSVFAFCPFLRSINKSTSVTIRQNWRLLTKNNCHSLNIREVFTYTHFLSPGKSTGNIITLLPHMPKPKQPGKLVCLGLASCKAGLQSVSPVTAVRCTSLHRTKWHYRGYVYFIFYPKCLEPEIRTFLIFWNTFIHISYLGAETQVWTGYSVILHI
jgi:hypothetical protein